MALTDVLRQMAETAFNSENNTCSGKVWQIIAMAEGMSDDDIKLLRVDFERRNEIVRSERRLKNSYITTTCNRMRLLQDNNKSVCLKFSEDESGDRVLAISIKHGRANTGSRSKSAELAERGAVKEFAKRIMGILPPLDQLDDDMTAGAVAGIRMMKALIEKEAGL